MSTAAGLVALAAALVAAAVVARTVLAVDGGAPAGRARAGGPDSASSPPPDRPPALVRLDALVAAAAAGDRVAAGEVRQRVLEAGGSDLPTSPAAADLAAAARSLEGRR